MDSDDSLIIMAVSNVVAALALLAIIGLTALPIDLAPTWADRAIEGPLKHFGATDPDYRIRIWFRKAITTAALNDTPPRLHVCTEVSNTGVNPVGHDERPWKLVFKRKDQGEIRWDPNGGQCDGGTELGLLEGEDVDGTVHVRLGFLYPGERGEFALLLSSAHEDILDQITVESLSTIDLATKLTRHPPEPGPLSKFGNVVYFIWAGVLAIPWLIGTIIVCASVIELRNPVIYLLVPVILSVSIGQVAIIAAMLAKLTQIIRWLVT